MPHVQRIGKVLRTIAMVGAVALLSACSPDPSAPGGEAPDASDAGGSGPGVAGSGAEQGAQGLLAETLAMEPQVRDVVGRLTGACLRDAGLDRFPAQTPTVAAGQPAVVAPTISPDLDQARIDGYGIHASTSGSESGPAGPAEFTWSSADEERRYQQVLTGAADGATVTDSTGRPTLGGCLGQARTAVYGEVAAPQSPATVIEKSARSAYAADQALTDAAAVWSGCLRQAGYPQLLDPADAQRYAQYFYFPAGERPGGPVPAGGPWPADIAKDKEIELAVADAGCADQAGLRAVQRQAWDATVTDAVDQHETQLFGYRDAMAAALQRGQQALGS
jgi:hypothetical protein